jgi:hypothetical protein
MRLWARTTVVGDSSKGPSQFNEAHVALAEGEGRLGAQSGGETAAAESSAKGIQTDLITETDGGGGAPLQQRLHGGDGATGVSDRLTISAPLAEHAHETADHGLLVVEGTVDHG